MYNQYSPKQAEADELNSNVNPLEGSYYVQPDGEIRYKKLSVSKKRRLEALGQAARMTYAMRQHQDFMNRPVNPDNLTPYGRQMYDRIYNQ